MLRVCAVFVVLCIFLCTGMQVSPVGPGDLDSDRARGENRASERQGRDQRIPDGEELLRKHQKLSDLPPEQAELKLKELVTRIDANGNEQLSASEMVEWMVRLEKAHKTQDLQDVFREADRNSNGFVTLAEFARTMSLEDRLTAQMDEVLAYSRPLFNGADENGDGQLTMKEYAAFMHPEIHPHMIDTLVQTFLEQFDNNDDGYISFYEYMAVYMPASADERGRKPGWADSTRAEFQNTLDKNRDGLLDGVEMRGWVMSTVMQVAHEEADKLLQHADKDKNGEVSQAEVLGEFDLFAASKLTHRNHVTHKEL